MQTMETGGEGDDDDYDDDDDEPPNLPDNAVAPPTSAQTWTGIGDMGIRHALQVAYIHT